MLITHNDWLGPDGERILSDTRRLSLRNDEGRRIIDCDFLLKATDGDVNFGDTKEGSFGVRVAGTMKVDAKLGGKITKTADALRHQLKREPTVEEIAARLKMEPAGVQEILSARERAKVASLDTSTTGDDEHGAPAVDIEKVRSSRYTTLQLPIEDKLLLQEATQKLKEMERKVVRYFFYHDLNQTEIARRMAISTAEA